MKRNNILSNLFAILSAFLVASVAAIVYRISGPDGTLFIILVFKACAWLLAGAVTFPSRLSLVCFLTGAMQIALISAIEMLMSGVAIPLVILLTVALAGAGAFMHLHSRANARLESLRD